MAADPLAWFPFYVSDFLNSQAVEMMSVDEVGAYVLLLCHDWKNGGISDISATSIARILRLNRRSFQKLWPALKPHFVQHEPGGRWYNPRLEIERAKALRVREAQRHNANVRWSRGISGGISHGSPAGMPSPLPHHTETKELPPSIPPAENGARDLDTRSAPKAGGNPEEQSKGLALKLATAIRAARVGLQTPHGGFRYAIPASTLDKLDKPTTEALEVIGGPSVLANVEPGELRHVLYQFAAAYLAGARS